MDRVLKILAVVACVVILYPAAHFILIESAGEVVTLTTYDADATPHQTHLWVVEHQGHSWVNAGTPDAEWLARIARNPQVEVTRDGAPEPFRAVPDATQKDAILRLMRDSYGFADVYVRAVVGGDPVPVRLEPRAEAP